MRQRCTKPPRLEERDGRQVDQLRKLGGIGTINLITVHVSKCIEFSPDLLP